MAEVSQKPSRTIILAVDQSKWSMQALEWFVENVYVEGDQVILLHVVEQPHFPFLADALGIEEWKQEVKKVEESLKALEKKYIDRCKELKCNDIARRNYLLVTPGSERVKLYHARERGVTTLESILNYDRGNTSQLNIRFKVEQGKPGEKICEIASKEKSTIIILSSRGAGLISRTILGSVSNYVIHHTKIPVLLCPRDHQ